MARPPAGSTGVSPPDTAEVTTPFEGRDVIQTTIIVRKAGDGLSTALAISARELHMGERVFLVLEGEVTKVGFGKVADTECLVRVHDITTETATFVDEELVGQVLSDQRQLNIEHASKKREKAKADKGEDPMAPGMGLASANGDGSGGDGHSE